MLKNAVYSSGEGRSMQLEELILKVSRLPASRQQEVMDFVMFLEQRYGEHEQADWSEQQFRAMSIEQADAWAGR
jgi:HEPN domain-containing protein